MDDILEQFCQEVGGDPDTINERWNGRPDLIMEDLFRVKIEGVLQPLKLFPYQRQIAHAYFFGDAATLNILKGRRIGGSFIIVLCMLLEGIQIPEQLYPIASTKEEQAYARIGDIEKLITNARIEIPLAKKPTKGEIILWNGTRFLAYTGSPKGARGEGARSVFFDEQAFMEGQEDMARAFKPMMALSKGKWLQVSTPAASNDLFMKTHERGTKDGYDEDGRKVGVISIFRPSFYNYEDIDPEVSLFDQEVEPVRPDMEIDQIEGERLMDPMGFAQEYLCKPLSEQYRFFDEESVDRAFLRGSSPDYPYGSHVGPQLGGEVFMAVDIGIEHDETVLTVWEHLDDHRFLRYKEVVTNEVLARSGIPDPDRGNAVHVAKRIGQVFRASGCSYVVLDATGAGQTFPRILETEIGQGVIGFNFSATEKVKKMFGEFNAALRSDKITLFPDDRARDQLLAVTRTQKEDWNTPRFSGKENSPDGKDDIAVALVMGAFPPGFETAVGTDVVEKPRSPRPEDVVASFKTATFSGAANSSRTTHETGGVAVSSLGRTYSGRYSRRSLGNY